MRFYETPEVTTETLVRWRETFADITFVCQACGSEDTHEHDSLVPAKTMHNVVCGACGAVGVGLPPKRYREPANR